MRTPSSWSAPACSPPNRTASRRSEVLPSPVHLAEVVTKGIAEVEEQFEEELEAEEQRAE